MRLFKIIYKIILLVVLILNVLLLTMIFKDQLMPQELTPGQEARKQGEIIWHYHQNLLANYQLKEEKSVNELLANFKYELETAKKPEDLTSLIFDYGLKTSEIILEKVTGKRIETILEIVNRQDLPEKGYVKIYPEDKQTHFFDPYKILTTKTKEEIKAIPLKQTVELEIAREAKLLNTTELLQEISQLQTQVKSLENKLQKVQEKSGYLPISGPGIMIKIYDKNTEREIEKTGIVHDSDIRTLINELKIAGAYGLEVGGQRLATNSAIRCVGPTILVNNEPIAVNPIIIKAVGDPEVLLSSLDIVKNNLKAFQIQLEIEIKASLTLTAIDF